MYITSLSNVGFILILVLDFKYNVNFSFEYYTVVILF